MRSGAALLLAAWIFIAGTVLSGQGQTVGLYFNTSHAENGYSLFTRHETAYLIDNCGYVVHTWENEKQKGGVLYLLENGDLLRASNIPAAVDGVPGGGLIMKYNWEGDVLWEYRYAYPLSQQHHDIQPMPNGNVLLLAWNLKSIDEAIDAGRDPDVISSYGILYESVIEVEPVGTDSGRVVWEWHMWDHLIQDHDSAKSNYGIPAEHPGLIDINFNDYSGGFSHDWVHANAVHYDPDFDEVVISAKNFSELWVIDHSTTTEEAASHTGGRHGKGGDVVYRWGNPQTYGRGDAGDRILYGQHDVHYVQDDMGYDGGIMMFNNGDRRPGEHYSEVVIIEPPRDGDGRFISNMETAYGPEMPSYAYSGMGNDRLSSRWLSSAHLLPNGNIFICEGNAGTFTEVDHNENVVWKYISPLNSSGIVTQGEEVDHHRIFRATRYPDDHPAFDDRNLTPQMRIEQDPLEDDCEVYLGSGGEEIQPSGIILVNNLISRELIIENQDEHTLNVRILSIDGQALHEFVANDDSITIEMDYPPGMYVLAVEANGRNFAKRFVIPR